MRATTTNVSPIPARQPMWPARRSGSKRSLPLDDVLVGREVVDALVVALADLAADHGEQQRDDDRRCAGDCAAGRQRVVPDRDPRQVQALEDVVLAAADGREARDDDRGEHGPEPDADALARAVEARHAARDVSATEPRDREDDEQGDAAAEPDLLRGVRVARVARRQAERDTGADEHRRQDRREADRAEPAEEVAAPLDAAEAVALAGAHRVEGGRREHRLGAPDPGVDPLAGEGVGAPRPAGGGPGGGGAPPAAGRPPPGGW